MFKINFRDIASQLSPWFFRSPKYLHYLNALVKPLSDINDNGKPVQFFDQKNRSFYQLTVYLKRFLQVSASRLVFQKYLNELWDATNEGILIVNNPTIYVKYKYNNSEQHVVNYKYNNWKSTVDYAASGEFVLAINGNVYESNTNPNLNNEPPHANWDLISTADEYLYNETDIYDADYTIKIPQLVTMQPGYSNERFMANVNYFNAAGRTYDGIVLGTSVLLFTNT